MVNRCSFRLIACLLVIYLFCDLIISFNVKLYYHSQSKASSSVALGQNSNYRYHKYSINFNHFLSLCCLHNKININDIINSKCFVVNKNNASLLKRKATPDNFLCESHRDSVRSLGNDYGQCCDSEFSTVHIGNDINLKWKLPKRNTFNSDLNSRGLENFSENGQLAQIQSNFINSRNRLKVLSQLTKCIKRNLVSIAVLSALGLSIYVPNVLALDAVSSNNLVSNTKLSDIKSFDTSSSKGTSSSYISSSILSDLLNKMRSGVTGEKVNEIRVGESLVRRLRSVEQDLEQIQKDIFSDSIDWEVISVYPKIFRTYLPLFTAYTDRAFPTSSPVDISLRYALRYEIGGFYNGVRDFEEALVKRSQRQLQRAFAKISLSYDRYYKAGDLYLEYDTNRLSTSLRSYDKPNDFLAETNNKYGTNDNRYKSKPNGVRDNYFLDQNSYDISKLSYIAPSIEAPALQDEVVLLKGPDKGRIGHVLWIAKGNNVELSNVVIKLQSLTSKESHREVKLYPYTFVAKTTPVEVQFFDDIFAAYIASAISCGIMYPIDSYKTRIQIGKRGIPSPDEGGLLGLYRGVQYFVADANDAVYVASYGLIKPLFLAPVDPTNGFVVFVALVLSGSAGDAIGSIFRLPMEIVYKRIQSGISYDGIKILLSLGSDVLPIKSLLVCWIAILLRDMPFAGLQIAFYDIYKNVFAFLDEQGWSMFAQSALWGVLAGGTAAWLTTPFDVLTTNILTAIEEKTDNVETQPSTLIQSTTSSNNMISAVDDAGAPLLVDSITYIDENNVSSIRNNIIAVYTIIISFILESSRLFQKSFKDIISAETSLQGQILALFNGSIERVLFFAPAAMIFFTTYESAFNVISVARENHGLWF